MITEDIKELVRTWASPTNPNKFVHLRMKAKVPEIEALIAEMNITYRQLFHLVRLGLDSVPLCPTCGQRIEEFWRREYCSQKCGFASPLRGERLRNTLREKYGVDNISQLQEIKDKKIETCRKNFGCDHPMQSKEILDKAVATTIKVYGVDRPSKSEIVKQHAIETNIKRYGVMHTPQAESVKAKIRATNQERYGANVALQLPEYRKKQEETMLEHFGVRFPSQAKSVMDKTKTKFRAQYVDRFFEEAIAHNLTPLFTREDYINGGELAYLCNTCMEEFTSDVHNVGDVFCPKCFLGTRSKDEQVMYAWLTSVCEYELVQNTRAILDGYELDIYIPELKLAIEFNGDYWHSTIHKDALYHYEKTRACEEKGIRLIHVFEWEWLRKQELVQRTILSALKMLPTLDCVDCEYRAIEPDKEALDKTCFSSYDDSLKWVGVYFEDILIQMIGYSQNENTCTISCIAHVANFTVQNSIVGFMDFMKCSAYRGLLDLTHDSTAEYENAGFVLQEDCKPLPTFVKYGFVVEEEDSLFTIFNAGTRIYSKGV